MIRGGEKKKFGTEFVSPITYRKYDIPSRLAEELFVYNWKRFSYVC